MALDPKSAKIIGSSMAPMDLFQQLREQPTGTKEEESYLILVTNCIEALVREYEALKTLWSGSSVPAGLDSRIGKLLGKAQSLQSQVGGSRMLVARTLVVGALSLSYEIKALRSHVILSTVYFTDATGAGVISGKTYEADTVPADKILTAFSSDNDDITVTLEIHSRSGSWMPDSVTVSGGGATPVTVERQNWTQVGSSRIWTASVNLTDADTSGVLTATMSDGDTATCTYTRLAEPPACSSADWGQNGGGFSSGEYPTSPDTGLQTAVKSGDEVYVQVTLDSSATRITVASGGAGTGSDQHFDDTYAAGTHVIGPVTCGSGTGSQVFTVKANRDGGSYGTSDDTPSISMDQASHSYTSLHNLVFSPADNFALKAGDSCTGDVEITNWSAGNDHISYTSSEVTVTDSGAYAETKTYTFLSGLYRDSGTNVTLTSRRKANGKQSSTSYLIKICNASATINMNGAESRLRSRATGGDKTYSLTAVSDFELKSYTTTRDAGPPADDGPALGAWSGSAPDKTWTNTITIQEDDRKNTGAETYSWEGVDAVTGSGISKASISADPTYTVGGFESRDVAMAAYEHYNPIGTQVSNKDNANKLSCEIVGVKELEYVENTTPAEGKFTITDSGGNFDADGTYVRCLDTDFIDLGLPYTLRIEEAA